MDQEAQASVIPADWLIDSITGGDEEEEKKTQSEEEAESGTSRRPPPAAEEKGGSRGSLGATLIFTAPVVGVASPAPPTATCGCFGVAGEPLPRSGCDSDAENADDDALPWLTVATPHSLGGATDEMTSMDKAASTGWGCFHQQQMMKESLLLSGATTATCDEAIGTDEVVSTGWGCFHQQQQMKESELVDPPPPLAPRGARRRQ